MYNRTSRTSIAVGILCFLMVPAWNRLHGTGEQAANRMMRVTVGVLCGATSDQPVVESGILVGDGAWVLTNIHVIRQSGSAGCIVFGPGLKIDAHLKDADEGTDLALLELASPSGRPGAVFASRLSKGQVVIALGYPNPGADKRFDDYSGSGSEGQFTGLRKAANGVDLIQTNMTFSSRDTGGPLFTMCGDVAGVNEESEKDAAIAGGHAYALLQKNDVQVEEAAAACQPAGAGTTQSGEETGSGETTKPIGESSTGSGLTHWGGEIPWGTYTLRVLGIISTLLGAMGTTKKGRQALTRAYQTVRYGRSTAYTPQQYTPQHSPPPLPAPAAPRPRLLAVAGPLSGRSFVLEGGITSIGRDPCLCQIVFPADTTKVSRHHCSLRLDHNGSILLEDCGSANGTFLASGARMEAGRTHRIEVGERFYLGSGSIGFELHGANA